MPRPIIGHPQEGGGSPTRHPISSPSFTRPTPGLDHRLRQRRTSGLERAIHSLDAGTHGADRASLERLLEAIAAEFPDLAVDERPIGLVARCHLGSPFVVHVCDLSGMIVEHYPADRSMPAPFERARSLALHPSYVYVEVYRDSLRAVAPDGSVSVVHA